MLMLRVVSGVTDGVPGLRRSCRRIGLHLLLIPMLLAALHQGIYADLQCRAIVAAWLLLSFDLAASWAWALVMQRRLLD